VNEAAIANAGVGKTVGLIHPAQDRARRALNFFGKGLDIDVAVEHTGSLGHCTASSSKFDSARHITHGVRRVMGQIRGRNVLRFFGRPLAAFAQGVDGNP
jgi:hypothetical protein